MLDPRILPKYAEFTYTDGGTDAMPNAGFQPYIDVVSFTKEYAETAVEIDWSDSCVVGTSCR